MDERPFVRALGALTGNQAVQQVKAGLEAIYLSGWQVAADANLAGHMYPDQSLYPANSVPHVVRRINQALQRADQIHHSEGRNGTNWFAPIVADAEAGFGGALNVFELMKAMIEAGAAGVHFEDQLASEKKCGHMGGKVLIPTSQAVRNLVSARLAADVMGVPTVIIARTDADAANLITSDVDPADHEFLTGERTMEGFYRVNAGIDQAISRGLSYAPYADVVWCETSEPNLEQARVFAEAIHEKFPGKLLAYNCSPSFNWKKKLSEAEISTFQEEIGAMGYRFQFVTLAGFHALNYSMFDLARNYEGARHGCLLRAAAGRVRRRGARLHRDQAPARGRRGLLRRGRPDRRRRHRLHHGPHRLHRRGPVRHAGEPGHRPSRLDRGRAVCEVGFRLSGFRLQASGEPDFRLPLAEEEPMARDPQGRLTDDGAQPVQPERPSGLAPEEVAEPGAKQNMADADWLSMATADPAFFLKDSDSE